MKSSARLLISFCMASWSCVPPSRADELKFERIVIDNDFPAAYQVEVADVNGDKKPDIIAVGGATCAWYENPSWKKRIITGPAQTPGIISSATTDLDGDGKAEVAIAYEFEMNKPAEGKLLLAHQGATPDDPWTIVKIEDQLGSIHRLRWGKVSGDATELVVAPLFGAEAKPPSYSHPSRIRVYQPRIPFAEGWAFSTHEIRENRPVLHAIEVKDLDGDGRDEILTADNLGVGLARVSAGKAGGGKWSFTNLVRGNDATVPKGGASEIHLGSFADGHRFLATVEPWHGAEVAIYREKTPKSLNFGSRTVIDNSLIDGHALWVADVDRDGTDEVFAGHRGKEHCVSVYRYADKKWHATVIDRDIAAQDLRGGDLNADGIPDIVAVGGTTHNVVWYKPLK